MPLLNTPAEVADKEAPMPVLPVVCKVDNLVSKREVDPATVNPESALSNELILAVAPTLTLPEVLRVDKLVLPSTFKDESKSTPEVTFKEVPTPTLPVTLSDEPMPTNPENLAVPDTSSKYDVVDVPIPTLP